MPQGLTLEQATMLGFKPKPSGGLTLEQAQALGFKAAPSTQQYTIQAPDGKVLTLEGPAGASGDEAIRQAQRLYQPQTVIDLGRKVKAKYPGQYDDLADADVGARVKAKYPDAYGDFMDVAKPGTSTGPTSWLDYLKSFVPTPRTIARVGGAVIGGGLGAASGATAGGIGALPGAIAGGGLGSAAGEAVYQNIFDRPQTSTEAATNILEAAAGGMLQEALPGVVSKITGKGAQLGTEQLLAPRTFGEKAQLRAVSDELSQQIPVRPTGAMLANALNVARNQARNAVNAAYSAISPTTKINTAPIKAALEAERDAHARVIGSEVAPGGEAMVGTYNRIIDWLGKNSKMSLADMRKDKALWDELVSYRKNANALTENEQVYQSAADKFRATINSLFPKIAEANANFHRLNLAAESFANRELGSMGKSAIMPSMGDALAAGIGGTIGSQFGGGAGEGALAGVFAKRLLTSPGFQSLSIATQRAISNALSRNDVALAVKILAGPGVQYPLQPGTTVNLEGR